MKPRRNSAAPLALVAGLGLICALPAIGQESLLPEGFGGPEPKVPPPSAPAPAAPAAARPVAPPPPGAADVPTLDLVPPDEGAPAEVAEEETAAPVELPDQARRPIDVVGALSPAQGGLDANAFGNADGRFLAALMRRIDAPVASRWASILLRRALLSRVPAPRGVPPADWVAERAWLLLRMGEADGARMLVQAVDTDRYSPKLVAVAAQTALATADPAALCPLVPLSQGRTDEAVWPLAAAMCTALSGDAAASGALIDRARRARTARGVDLFLAEKVVGAGGGRRQIAIEWDGVDRLTSWRFGIATALGVAIPDPLFATAGPQVQAWRARAPMVPLAARVGAARVAAALGVLSNAALVDLYGAIADETDPLEINDSPAGRLRTAYVAADADDRLKALRTLWKQVEDPRGRYGDLVLTAQAAARVPPSNDRADDAATLIAAMLSAGLDLQAERWAGVAGGMSSDAGDRAWALLALGAPDTRVDLGYRRVSAFADRAGGDGRHRAQLLVAGLAGLGRLSAANAARLAGEVGLGLATQNRWTQALDLAAAGGQTGTVALLAAAGMQTRDWAAVPPAYLYHIVAALRRVGREPEARMIAAEAVSRT